jgi:hypothetical protein
VTAPYTVQYREYGNARSFDDLVMALMCAMSGDPCDISNPSGAILWTWDQRGEAWRREEYIPHARDSVVGRFGRTPWGVFRSYCNRCLASGSECHGYDGRTESDRVFGDMMTSWSNGSGDMLPDSEECDACRVPLATLAAQCEAEHRLQQARWARSSAPTVLVEYGIPAMVRCRVY